MWVLPFIVAWQVLVGALIAHDIRHPRKAKPLNHLKTGCYTIWQWYGHDLRDPLPHPRETTTAFCWSHGFAPSQSAQP